MLLIQIIINLVIVFFVVNLFIKLRRDQIGLVSFIFWLFFWLAGIVIISWPESTNFLARTLGVGRGADVILYFSIIIIFYFIFYLTIKLRKIEKEITQVVRQITYQDKEKDAHQ